MSEKARLYAVGDIHGRADLLAGAISRIDSHLLENPTERHVRIFLGDYVDRGPDSRGVIDRLIELDKRCETVFLKGNHETILLDFIENPSVFSAWQSLGGLETLASYGVSATRNADPTRRFELSAEFRAALPTTHRTFLSRLRPCYSIDDFFFAHAGVRPHLPLNAQVESDLIWIRGEFIDYRGMFQKMIVHGHTPVRTPDVQPNRINLDTGAYITGLLTCLWIEGNRMGFL